MNFLLHSDWDCYPDDYEITKERIEAKASGNVLAFISGSTRQVLSLGKDLSDCMNRMNRNAYYEWTIENDELKAIEDGEELKEIFYRVFKESTTPEQRQKLLKAYKSGKLSRSELNKWTEKLGQKIMEVMK